MGAVLSNLSSPPIRRFVYERSFSHDIAMIIGLLVLWTVSNYTHSVFSIANYITINYTSTPLISASPFINYFSRLAYQALFYYGSRLYLSQRSFSIKASCHCSPPLPLSSGVSQGSVMGPFFFILFTTSLRHVTESFSVDLRLYTEDTISAYPSPKLSSTSVDSYPLWSTKYMYM